MKLCNEAEKGFQRAYDSYEEMVQEKRESEMKSGVSLDILLLAPEREDFLCKDKECCGCSA